MRLCHTYVTYTAQRPFEKARWNQVAKSQLECVYSMDLTNDWLCEYMVLLAGPAYFILCIWPFHISILPNRIFLMCMNLRVCWIKVSIESENSMSQGNCHLWKSTTIVFSSWCRWSRSSWWTDRVPCSTFYHIVLTILSFLGMVDAEKSLDAFTIIFVPLQNLAVLTSLFCEAACL